MIEERIQYGIDNFLEEKFFLPSSSSYCLEEKEESGRSELQVDVEGDNLCSEDYDHKGKCNFLRDGKVWGLKIIFCYKKRKKSGYYILLK